MRLSNEELLKSIQLNTDWSEVNQFLVSHSLNVWKVEDDIKKLGQQSQMTLHHLMHENFDGLKRDEKNWPIFGDMIIYLEQKYPALSRDSIYRVIDHYHFENR